MLNAGMDGFLIHFNYWEKENLEFRIGFFIELVFNMNISFKHEHII